MVLFSVVGAEADVFDFAQPRREFNGIVRSVVADGPLPELEEMLGSAAGDYQVAAILAQSDGVDFGRFERFVDCSNGQWSSTWIALPVPDVDAVQIVGGRYEPPGRVGQNHADVGFLRNYLN